MTGPHDPLPDHPDDDLLARSYRELGGLGVRTAGAPDLGDLLRRDRQRERRRVAGTALAVVSTMGVAAWAGSALLGAGRGGPQTLPAAPVAVSTTARHATAADPTGTRPAAPSSTAPAGPVNPAGSTGPSVTPVVGSPTTDPSSGSAVGTASRTVQVWFESTATRSDGCHPLRAVTRQVSADDPVTGALHQLLLGPTKAEQQDGLRSDFGPGLAAGATVTRAGGSVIVDLGGLGRLATVPTACRRAQVAGPLNQTLAQFTSVKTRVFTLKGDAAAFRAYLSGA